MSHSAFLLYNTTAGLPPYPVTESGVRIGRSPECGIMLADDAVSWSHALVRVVEGGVVVTDEDSTNGVYINNRRIPALMPHPLQPGEMMRIGGTTFTVSVTAQSIVQPPIEWPTAQPIAPKRSAWPWVLIGLGLSALVLIGLVLLNNASVGTITAPLPATLTRTATNLPPTAIPTDTPRAPTVTLTPGKAAGTVPPPRRDTLPTNTPPTSAPPAVPLINSLESVLKHLQGIGGALDRLSAGSGREDCQPLLADYYSVANAPTYGMSGQTTATQNAYTAYRQAISLITTKINSIRQVCESGGGSLGTLDFSVARTAINDANDLLNSAFKALGK